VPFDGVSSVTAFLTPESAAAVPNITVSDGTATWHPERDLLSSAAEDHVFVPEIEQDGRAFLRFGDDQHGMAAETGMVFTATYRVGNGAAGNVAPDTLGHAVLPVPFLPPLADIQEVRNPLPATGGVDPENMQHIRQFAPFSYQTQERCVTEADYGQMASQFPGVSAAKGTLRWTGSWYTAFVTLEPVARTLTSQLIEDATTRLDMLRMMGTDIAIEAAVLVGLQIELAICVDPSHFQRDVYQALTQVFISGDRCDGTTGLLNPTRFTFGETVYASPLIAAAQEVEGVVSATLTTFSRMDQPWVDGVAQGFLTMGRLEIPRCDNDPDHLDHGIFTLTLDGGK
jgi:predicted phage baseplate assembly protein